MPMYGHAMALILPQLHTFLCRHLGLIQGAEHTSIKVIQGGKG